MVPASEKQESIEVNATVSASIEANYGRQVRVRVCGLAWHDDALLLVKHTGLGPLGYYWSPPGGGLNFGETIEDCLAREFLEETGLHVSVGPFLFANQYINPPLHAIELFYAVEVKGGTLKLGYDPELGNGPQMLTELAYLPYPSIQALHPDTRHHSFQFAQNVEAYKALSGWLPVQHGHGA